MTSSANHQPVRERHTAGQHPTCDEERAAFPHNPTAIVALDASHSPFLSMPEQVADILAKLG
jgi:hypothetical protein